MPNVTFSMTTPRRRNMFHSVSNPRPHGMPDHSFHARVNYGISFPLVLLISMEGDRLTLGHPPAHLLSIIIKKLRISTQLHRTFVYSTVVKVVMRKHSS